MTQRKGTAKIIDNYNQKIRDLEKALLNKGEDMTELAKLKGEYIEKHNDCVIQGDCIKYLREYTTHLSRLYLIKYL